MSTIVHNEPTYDFPMMALEASTQTPKRRKPQLLLNEFAEVTPKISKATFVAPNEIKKFSSENTDHNSLLKLKKQIQNLIDFQSLRIGLREIPTNDFSKNIHISQNFQLITLDGEPLPQLMLCKKCKQVRARCRLTSTPIVRHLKQHDKVEKARKIDKKKQDNRNALLYGTSLTRAMKNYTAIPLRAQEYGNHLSRGKKRSIEKTILSQGAPEAQIALYNNLKSILRNKINLENSEQKKKQLYQEHRDLETLYYSAKHAFTEKRDVIENRLTSPDFRLEEETQQTRTLEDNDIPISIPEGNNTSITTTLRTQERTEDTRVEIISSAPPGNDEPIKYGCLISENEIKLEINNE